MTKFSEHPDKLELIREVIGFSIEDALDVNGKIIESFSDKMKTTSLKGLTDIKNGLEEAISSYGKEPDPTDTWSQELTEEQFLQAKILLSIVLETIEEKSSDNKG